MLKICFKKKSLCHPKWEKCYAIAMIRLIFMLVALMGLSSGCKNSKKNLTSLDFETLSGKDLPAWKHVQTKEDFNYLSLFTTIYEAQKKPLAPIDAPLKIPKIIHFIWLGERPFPRASVDHLRTWMAQHPDWTVKFWTDRDRPLPVPGMIYSPIQALPLTYVADCLKKSTNPAEQSDLLRLEILYQEGGIYVDHDVKCLKPFTSLNQTYDFYCGIDMPFFSSLPSCIYPTNNLIGSIPHHPILKCAMEQLAVQWDALEVAYPGSARDEVLNRVLHRTFWLFGDAFKRENNQNGLRDIVFPAYYFDAPSDDLAIFARHLYAGTWHETENSFEKMVRKRLMYLSKKSNKMLLFIGILSGINLLGLLALLKMQRASKSR